MAVVLVIAVAMAWGVARLGDAAVRRARAAAVADLTALASVTGGDPAAELVAATNGAEIRSITGSGSTVVVTVTIDGVSDVAAARPG